MSEGSESKKGNHIVHPSHESGLCGLTVRLLSRGRPEGMSIGLIWYGYNWSLKKLTSKAGQSLRANVVTLLIKVPSNDKDGK